MRKPILVYVRESPELIHGEDVKEKHFSKAINAQPQEKYEKIDHASFYLSFF